MPQLLPSPYRLQKPPPGSQIDWSHPLADALQNAFVFNESGGGISLDVASGAIAKFISTAGWGVGLSNTAAKFDGSSAQVTSIGSPLGNIASNLIPWSVVAWVNAASSSAGSHNIITCGNGTAGGCLQIRRDAGVWNFYRKPSGSFEGPATYTPALMTKWTQVVGSFDGSRIRLFIDGMLRSTISVTGTTTSSQGNNAYIGSDVSTQFWDGLIDHVLLYNKALLPDAVIQLYNEPFCMLRGPDAWRRAA